MPFGFYRSYGLEGLSRLFLVVPWLPFLLLVVVVAVMLLLLLLPTQPQKRKERGRGVFRQKNLHTKARIALDVTSA